MAKLEGAVARPTLLGEGTFALGRIFMILPSGDGRGYLILFVRTLPHSSLLSSTTNAPRSLFSAKKLDGVEAALGARSSVRSRRSRSVAIIDHAKNKMHCVPIVWL